MPALKRGVGLNDAAVMNSHDESEHLHAWSVSQLFTKEKLANHSRRCIEDAGRTVPYRRATSIFYAFCQLTCMEVSKSATFSQTLGVKRTHIRLVEDSCSYGDHSHSGRGHIAICPCHNHSPPCSRRRALGAAPCQKSSLNGEESGSENGAGEGGMRKTRRTSFRVQSGTKGTD